MNFLKSKEVSNMGIYKSDKGKEAILQVFLCLFFMLEMLLQHIIYWHVIS